MHIFHNRYVFPPSLSPFHSFDSRRLFLPGTDVPQGGCFFLPSLYPPTRDIDPLYSYYYKRVTLLCSRAVCVLAFCIPFVLFAVFARGGFRIDGWAGGKGRKGKHNNTENTTPSLRFPRRDRGKVYRCRIPRFLPPPHFLK